MGGVVTDIGKGLGAIVTGGTSLIKGSPTQKLGNTIGNALTLGQAHLGSNGGGGLQAPTVQGQQNPMQVLQSSGGAPLLMNVALGADPQQSIMGYFGASGNFDSWIASLNPEDHASVIGVVDQLKGIQTDTNLKNQAVQQLTNDFPNIMAQKIPQYMSIADDATKQIMQQSMDMISAKQAAGGMFSSGATAQAAAQAGAGIAMDKLNYGTGLAYQDFNNQLSSATALQSFQQKMLGQGAAQGFNAVQNALSNNAGIGKYQGALDFNAAQTNQNQTNSMNNALGGLAGTVIGGAVGGPPGAAIGSQLGGVIGGTPSPTFSPYGYRATNDAGLNYGNGNGGNYNG